MSTIAPFDQNDEIVLISLLIVERTGAAAASAGAAPTRGGVRRARTESFASAAAVVAVSAAAVIAIAASESVVPSVIPAFVSVAIAAVSVATAVSISSAVIAPVVTAAATATAISAASFRLPFGNFYFDGGAVNSRAVERVDGVLGVAVILEVDEAEAGRIAGHPHVANRAEPAEGLFQVHFRRAGTQVADVHLRVGFSLVVESRHLLGLFSFLFLMFLL